MVPRTVTQLPASPLANPQDAHAFAGHLPLAVEAAERHGTDLALVVLRAATSGRRGRDRLHAALRAVHGFAYELQPGGYAVLMGDATAWEAFTATLTLREHARGGVLRPGACVEAGVAVHAPGMSARALFDAAAAALDDAERLDRGVVVWPSAAPVAQLA